MAVSSRMLKLHPSVLQVASMIKNNEEKNLETIGKKTRERNANYNREETKKLIKLVLPRISVVENKKNGSCYWLEKQRAWKEITKEFNRGSKSYNYRDSKSLRLRFDTVKKYAKKKWADILAGRREPNGSMPKLTPVEKKLIEILEIPTGEDAEAFIRSINNKSNEEDDVASSSASDEEIKKSETVSVKVELIESDGEDDSKIGEGVHNDVNNSEDETPRKRRTDDPLTSKELHSEDNDSDYDILVEEKIAAVRLQKQLLKRKIQLKEQKIKMLDLDMEHRRAIHELEKQRLLMEIEKIKNGQQKFHNTE